MKGTEFKSKTWELDEVGFVQLAPPKASITLTYWDLAPLLHVKPGVFPDVHDTLKQLPAMYLAQLGQIAVVYDQLLSI